MSNASSPAEPPEGFSEQLEEPEVKWQALLRDPPMRTEPRTQERPETLHRVDVNLPETIPVINPGIILLRMADCLVAVAPID
jgi:hypothetical protein